MSNVTHPSHYNTGKIEVLEFLEDQKLDYHLGNTVKYICRAGRKDPNKTIEDLEKGMFYLKRKLELLRAEAAGRTPIRPNEMNSRALGDKLRSGGKRKRVISTDDFVGRMEDCECKSPSCDDCFPVPSDANA